MKALAPQTLLGGGLGDCASALLDSFQKLSAAASNANQLLSLTGYAGTPGDTADDLHKALAMHGQLVQEFTVKVRTSAGVATFNTTAATSVGAAHDAAARQGDTPCGITVTPAEPTRQALAAAHRTLRIAKPLDAALDDPALGRALRSYARKHPVRTIPTKDFKSLAANDRD